MTQRVWLSSLTIFILLAGCGPAFHIEQQFIGTVEEFDVDGLRVVLHTDTNTPFVSVGLFINGGAHEVPVNISIATEELMLSSMVHDGPASGSTSHFHRVMQQLDIPIRTIVNKNYSLIGFRSLAHSLDTVWKYFAGSICDPKFTSTTLRRLIRQKLTDITIEEDAPDSYATHLAEMLCFTGHAYSRYPTEQTIAALTEEDFQNYHEYTFIKERLLVVASGNISRETLRTKILSSQLVNLPSLPTYRQRVGKQIAQENSRIAFSPFSRKLPTIYVRGILLGPHATSASDYYAFKYLCRILNANLTYFLRVRRHLSYAPQVEFVPGSPSYCVIAFETDSVREAMMVTNSVLNLPKQYYYSPQEPTIASASNTYALKEQQSSWRRVIELGEAKLLTGTSGNAFADYYIAQPALLTRVANKYLKNIVWVAVGDTTQLNRK